MRYIYVFLFIIKKRIISFNDKSGKINPCWIDDNKFENDSVLKIFVYKISSDRDKILN